MDCHFVHNHLFSYHENKLSDDEKLEFEAHLASCHNCNRIATGFQFVTTSMNKKKDDKPNPFIGTRTIQRIESELEQGGVRQNPLFLRKLQPIIVSLLLLISVVLGFSIGRQIDALFSITNERDQKIQAMKSGLSIPEFIDENAFFENN